MVVREGIGRVNDSTYEGKWWYPVLTTPLAGKGLVDAVCPGDHFEYVRQFLPKCSKILVIGTSGQDQDLLTLLNDSLPERDTRLIHFVGDGESRTEESLARFKGGVTNFQTNLVITYCGGFQNYLTGSNYRRFVEHTR